MLNLLSRIVLVTGHYGSGKTNFSVNLALELRRAGRKVALCDLDIVNPYFRSADFEGLMRREGIETISPTFANTNLDVPSLGAGLSAVLAQPDKTVVVDVGGDDAGAVALGRYAPAIARQGYTMLYVYNHYRYLTRDPADALEILEEIHVASRLRGSFIVNNSNLGGETDAAVIERSFAPCGELSALSALPVLCVTAPRALADSLSYSGRVFPVDLYVKKPWEA